jgi:hypothetical protein
MSTVHNESTALQLRASSRGGFLVVGSLLAASVPLGFIAYGRFKASHAAVGTQIETMRLAGRDLTTEQCVDRALQLRAGCSAMPALCDHAVGETMDACLQARDRASECAALGQSTGSTRFGFDACKARKTDRSGRVACATAYRAIAETCQSIGRPR